MNVAISVYLYGQPHLSNMEMYMVPTTLSIFQRMEIPGYFMKGNEIA